MVQEELNVDTGNWVCDLTKLRMDDKHHPFFPLQICPYLDSLPPPMTQYSPYLTIIHSLSVFVDVVENSRFTTPRWTFVHDRVDIRKVIRMCPLSTRNPGLCGQGLVKSVRVRSGYIIEKGKYTAQANVGFVKSTSRDTPEGASVNVPSFVGSAVVEPSSTNCPESGSRPIPHPHPHRPHRRPLRLHLHLVQRLVQSSAYWRSLG